MRLIIRRLWHARLSVARVLRTLVLLLNLSARGQPETSYLAALRLVAASITKFDEQIEKRTRDGIVIRVAVSFIVSHRSGGDQIPVE